MESKLSYNTIKPLLLSVLKTLMAAKEFDTFRLVGGTHDQTHIRKRFSDFESADEDFDPVCLKSKHWEIIKLDMIDFANGSLNG